MSFNKSVKSGIQSDAARSKREKISVSIRKEKKQEHLHKRRKEALTELATTQTHTQLQKLPEFVQMILTEDLSQQIEGTKGLRQLLSLEMAYPIDFVIKENLLPRLVAFLHSPSHDLQFEAAWALTNVASGNSQQTEAVVNAGAVPALVKCIGTPGKLNVKEQCIWALGNIAGEGAFSRNYILMNGAMGVAVSAIEQAIHENNRSILKNVVWALANLCRAKPLPEAHLLAPALPLLSRLLSFPDNGVVSDAMWAFVYLTDSDDTQDLGRIIDLGIVPRIMELAAQDAPNVQTPCLRTLGNLLTGNDRQSDFVLSLGFLLTVKNIILTAQPALQREAIWALSNVTAGNARQISQVFELGLMVPVLKLLANASFEVRKEALWCTANALVSGNPEHAAKIVQEGALMAITQLLAVNDTDTILVALDALSGLLRHGQSVANETGEANCYVEALQQSGGFEKICDLQKHPDEKVYNKSFGLLTKYFSEVGEEEEGAPEVVGQSYQFQYQNQGSFM
ncbi:hypothetical protein RCL1_002393 [Eukaryota sp. TZLM3-RCL]